MTVLALLAYGLASKGESALAVGDPAPDKELPVLGEEGQSASLADYRGRWLLVNFWASWCEPCRTEAPALERFSREEKGRLVVLGINLDDASEDALAFIEEFGLTYPQLRDGDGRDRRDAFGMTGFPESFLVDAEGRIALIHRGPVDAEFLAREVQPLIEPTAVLRD